ncbi:uncharacterized protein BDV17DRAFT_21180 [Aspergillus undulatus]|uniref:uncharacterized protein n=1 Tax=Aspergillus undulatus TaxID=1810928 RepID=UPI003CCD3702
MTGLLTLKPSISGRKYENPHHRNQKPKTQKSGCSGPGNPTEPYQSYSSSTDLKSLDFCLVLPPPPGQRSGPRLSAVIGRSTLSSSTARMRTGHLRLCLCAVAGWNSKRVRRGLARPCPVLALTFVAARFRAVLLSELTGYFELHRVSTAACGIISIPSLLILLFMHTSLRQLGGNCFLHDRANSDLRSPTLATPRPPRLVSSGRGGMSQDGYRIGPAAASVPSV